MHPFVKILCFIMLLLLSNVLSKQMIFLLCILLIVFALKLDLDKFLRVVKRMRWLFLSIFVIYAFGTPGEYLEYFPNNYAPTFEGISLAVLQITKLLIALASLSIIFSTSSKEDLMLGLYMLLSPLKMLGLNVQRFSARLLLTLEYVEALAEKGDFKSSLNMLDQWHEPKQHESKCHASKASFQEHKVIVMQFPVFNFMDKLLMSMMMLGILAAVGWVAFI